MRVRRPRPRRSILIVTQEIDPHADVMVLHLKERGIRPIRYHPQDIAQGSDFSCAIADGKAEWELATGAGRFGDRQIGAVWYRRPLFTANPALPEEEREFARQEIKVALQGLFRLSGAFWVNHPDAIQVAESKLYQLRVAQLIGFRVPATLVTNRPDDVTAFHARHGGDVICKALTQGLLGWTEGKGIYTTVLTADHLSHVALVRNAPVLLQARIGKRSDIRVTVIGRRLFATEILSQEQAASRTDWRRGAIETMEHRPHELPADISARCVALVRGLGLVYGAIDLVRTPAGGYVFLEINPSGQFAWIESKTKQPLVRALADLLIAHT